MTTTSIDAKSDGRRPVDLVDDVRNEVEASQPKNLFFDLPESLRQHIFEFDPTYKNLYAPSLKELSMNVRIIQILLRQTEKCYPTARNILDYFYEEHKYKFQGIEYSTIKYFDCDNFDIDNIINVGHHLNEDDYEMDIETGIYIFCKCKFLTQENKIIFLAFLFDEVAYWSCNGEPYDYKGCGVHICPCEESDGLPRININTYFWSNMIKRNGQYPKEIVRSENNETFETITMFPAETMLFIDNM